MYKILLVEDDNNLREIYEARLQAEGYAIVSAKDGEEALVVAKNEKPDLVIADVMMPKISGFEMLDILRNTDGFKETKVIMLTALGQTEDKSRAESLGADRYLVKSQVTLEDIVKTAHELLGDGTQDTSTASGGPAPTDPAPPQISPTGPLPGPPSQPTPPTPTLPPPQTPPTSEPVVTAPQPPAPQNQTNDAPASITSPPPRPSTQSPPANIVQPPVSVPGLASTESSTTEPAPTPAPTVLNSAEPATQESAEVESQIENFINNPSGLAAEAANAPQAPETDSQSDADAAKKDAVMQDAIDDLTSSTEVNRPSEIKAVDVSDQTPEAAEPSSAPAGDKPEPEPDNVETEDGDKIVIKPNSNSEVETPPEPTPEPAPQPKTEESAEDPMADGNSIAHKKVIQPLEHVGKPDINELLAKEEALEAAAKAGENQVPDSFGTPPSNSDANDNKPSGGLPNSNEFDPNNIAL